MVMELVIEMADNHYVCEPAEVQILCNQGHTWRRGTSYAHRVTFRIRVSVSVRQTFGAREPV